MTCRTIVTGGGAGAGVAGAGVVSGGTGTPTAAGATPVFRAVHAGQAREAQTATTARTVPITITILVPKNFVAIRLVSVTSKG